MVDLEYRLSHRKEEEQEKLRQQEQHVVAQITETHLEYERQQQSRKLQELEQIMKANTKWKESKIDFKTLIQQLQIKQKFEILQRSLLGGPIFDDAEPPVILSHTGALHDDRPNDILGKQIQKSFSFLTTTRTGTQLLNTRSGQTRLDLHNGGSGNYYHDWSKKQELSDRVWTLIHPSYFEHNDTLHLNISLFYDFFQLRDQPFLGPKGYELERSTIITPCYSFGLLPLEVSLDQTKTQIDDMFVKGFDAFREIDQTKDIHRPLDNTFKIDQQS